MKKKLSIKLNHYIFILSLILISCIGVGFSSWIISGNNSSGKGDVNINVGDYIDNNGIASMNVEKEENGVKCFSFCKDGFVNDNAIDINNGYLYAYLKLDVNKIKEAYKNPSDTSTYTSLFFTSYLTFETSSSSNLFTLISENFISTKNDSSCGISAFYYSNLNPKRLINLNSDSSISNGLLTSNFSGFNEGHFANSTYFYLTLKFNFKIDYEKIDFETLIYPNLVNSKFSFNFGIGGY